jgi:transposase
MNYYIGADYGIQKHSIHIMSENDERVKEFEIKNDLKGFKELGSVVEDLENVQFCFETKHGPLVDYFREKSVKMYSVNPLKIKRFKQIKNVTWDNDDRIDARTLSEYLKVHHTKMHAMIFNSTEIEELNMLRISHDRITKEHIQCVNRLTFLFRQYLLLYGDLFCSTSVNILSHIILHYPT